MPVLAHSCLCGIEVFNADADGPNNSYSMFNVCIANKPLFFWQLACEGLNACQSQKCSMVMSWKQFVTRQLSPSLIQSPSSWRQKTGIGVHLIDFFNSGMSFEGPVINGDSNWDQLSSKLLYHWYNYIDFYCNIIRDFTSNMFSKLFAFAVASKVKAELFFFFFLTFPCSWRWVQVVDQTPKLS